MNNLTVSLVIFSHSEPHLSLIVSYKPIFFFLVQMVFIYTHPYSSFSTSFSSSCARRFRWKANCALHTRTLLPISNRTDVHFYNSSLHHLILSTNPATSRIIILLCKRHCTVSKAALFILFLIVSFLQPESRHYACSRSVLNCPCFHFWCLPIPTPHLFHTRMKSE